MVNRCILIVLMIFSLLTAGCWNQRDPELLAIVLATAFDYDEEKEMHLIIVQVANPQAMHAEVGGGSDTQSFITLSAHGHTPFEAMRTLTLGLSRELFWAHNRVILFSEKAARHGIREMMDVMERERQMRAIGRPAVVQGDIRKLMEAKFPLEETGAMGIDRQMVTIQLDKSVFHTKLLNEIYSAIEAPGQETVMGKIEVMPDGADAQEQEGTNAGSGENANGGGGSSSQPPPPAKLGGAALFKGDKLVGWGSQNQAEGWLLAAGRGWRFSFILENPDNPGYFSAEIFNPSAKMEPVVKNGKPRMIIRVEAVSRIQNYSGGILSESVASMEKRVAQAIRNRIKDVIKRSQDLNTDIMGFGNRFYRKHPAFWQEVEESWDDIFPTLVVDIEVKVNIMRTGLVLDPIKIE